jgi:hypothetical protein
VNALQRDLANTLRTAVRGKKPEQIVTINGAEYARLYRVPPPPNKSPAGTQFGPLRLERSFLRSEERRYLKSDDIHAGDTLVLTLRWTLTEPTTSVHFATVSLLDRQGRVVAETTDQVGGPDESTISVRVDDFVTELHRLVLPPEADGDYLLAVSVRGSQDGPPIAVQSFPERLGSDMRRPAAVIVDSVQARPPSTDES